MSFAAQALSHRTLRRRHFLGFGLLTLLLIWAALWMMAAFQLNKAVDAWVEAAKTNGITLAFTERSTDGTPFTAHVHLMNAALKMDTGSHDIRAEEAVLYLSLWDWNTISTKLRRNIQGQIGGLPFTAEVFKVGFEKPEHLPLNHMETGFSLWVQTLGLTLKPQEPLPLGDRLDQLAFELRVMGTPPDFTKADSVRAWNNDSGVLEFDALDLAWGPLGLSAKGTLGLNNDLQPEGAFSGKVDGLNNTINQLVSKGVIEARQESLLRSSIGVLSRPSGMMGGAAPIIPISLQSGGLYLGPVRIMAITPIAWQ